MQTNDACMLTLAKRGGLVIMLRAIQMKAIGYVFSGALVAFAPLAVAGGVPQAAAPQAATKNPVKPTPDNQAKAKQLYSIDCALCHGDNGNGKTDLATSMNLKLADFSDPATLADVPDGDLFAVIRNGKDKMPGEDAGRAKDNDIWGLILYVRSLSKPAAAK